MSPTQSDACLLKLYAQCIKVSPKCPNKACCKLWLTAPVLESSVSEDIVLQTLLEDYIVCHLCWEAHLGECVPLVCVTCGCEELSGAASNWIPPWLGYVSSFKLLSFAFLRSTSSRRRYTQTQYSIASSFLPETSCDASLIRAPVNTEREREGVTRSSLQKCKSKHHADGMTIKERVRHRGV